MTRAPSAPPQKVPLTRRVPGAPCSLAIAALCMGLSAWLAWRHPLVQLRLAPRHLQPAGGAEAQRLIIDGTVDRRAWGLFTVGHEDLEGVSHFMMHTRSGSASLLAVSRGEAHEIFTDDAGGIMRFVTQLNTYLDHTEPSTVVVRRTSWLLFAWSWALLVLGCLVMIRNVIVAPLRRRARRSLRQGR